MTLTEFLLARIAEDEAWARKRGAVYGSHWQPHDHPRVIGDIDPARVLAECEAKRRIVESCRADYEYAQGRNDDTTELAEEVLWHLAAIYADHDDYREEWKP